MKILQTFLWKSWQVPTQKDPFGSQGRSQAFLFMSSTSSAPTASASLQGQIATTVQQRSAVQVWHFPMVDSNLPHTKERWKSVMWTSNFCQLNELIECKVCNLPKIQDILNKQKGHSFFSKIEVSMHHHTFELDEEARNLCTICTAFGNCHHNQLPVGVSQSLDIAQEVMEDLFC